MARRVKQSKSRMKKRLTRMCKWRGEHAFSPGDPSENQAFIEKFQKQTSEYRPVEDRSHYTPSDRDSRDTRGSDDWYRMPLGC